MSKIRPLFALALCLSAPRAASGAEIAFPSRSPYATVSQWLGLTNITVTYTTPAVAGRSILGGVVKPGSVWLVGEGLAPTVSFSQDVVIGTRAIPAGSYSLLAIPTASSWTVILNRQARLGEVAARNPALDVGRFVIRPQPAPPRERLTFLFTDFADDRTTLDLEWEKVRVRIPIALRTEEQIREAIQRLDEGWQPYAEAARYMLEKKHDVAAGLKYVNQSLALRETWQNVWLKASLLAARGDYVGARAQANHALELGHVAGASFTAESDVRDAVARWSYDPLAKLPPERPEPRHRAGRAPEPRVGKISPSSPSSPFSPSWPTRTTVAIDSESFPQAAERPVDPTPVEARKPPSSAAFAPIIKRGRPDLEHCYQRALREDPSLTTARVTVSITVGASGRVGKVAVDPPLASGTLERCLKDVVSRWPFPAAPLEYEAQVPLTLSGR
jgi:hypothetical protein